MGKKDTKTQKNELREQSIRALIAAELSNAAGQAEPSQAAHFESLRVDRVSTNQNHSVQFALVLVANFMLLNGGALVAFPNFVKKLNENSQVTSLGLHAAFWFVVGIVTAAICGYMAYWNYSCHTQYEACLYNKRIFDAKNPDADYKMPDVRAFVVETEIKMKKYASWISRTMWIGNLSGIASLICFVVGCYYSGLMVLN